MATTFFLLSAVNLSTVPTNWSSAATNGGTLSLTRGLAATNSVASTVAALVAAANPQGTGTVQGALGGASTTLAAAGTIENWTAAWWISNPINPVTISGNITMNMRALESAAAANYGMGMKVYRYSNGQITNAFAQGSSTVELGTSEAAVTATLTPTSTAFLGGDRIVLAPFYVGVGGSTSGRTATFFYNGPTSAASGDAFITFTETITLRQRGAPAINFNDPAFFMRRYRQRIVERGRILVPGLWLPGGAPA